MRKSPQIMAEYRALYDAAGRFHDAPPHLFEGLDEYLSTLQAPEVGRRAFRHTYGFEYCYEADPIVSAAAFLVPDYVDSNTLIATLPRIVQYDHLEKEWNPVPVANFTTYRSGNGYLVLASTQFVRLVEDFSVIRSSTTPGPNGRAVWNIAPDKMPDYFAAVITDRWLSNSMPPTWGHGFDPETVLNNELWFLSDSLMKLSCWSFLIYHELGHIALGHLADETAHGQPADAGLSVEQELAADAWAIPRCTKPILDYAQTVFRTPKDGLAGTADVAILTVMHLLGFLAALSGHSEGIHSHPEPGTRISAAEQLLLAEAVRFGAKGAIMAGMMSMSEFWWRVISKRLPADGLGATHD